jgi:hypothetical protein
MKWNKLGLVFSFSDIQIPDATSHMQLPTIERTGDILNVFFSSRNKDNISSIKHAVCDLNWNILDCWPYLNPGDCGTFSDSGVMPGSYYRGYLYYTGWHLKQSVPYGQAIGCHTNWFNEPILSYSSFDPYLCNSPFVLYDNNMFKMWYVSGTGWYEVNGKLKPSYQINYATSANATHWKVMHRGCIQNSKDESISRPCVIKDDEGYKMWYGYMSVTTPKYQIGYAESADGVYWTRKDDESGIGLSDTGWDSEMMSYPYVITINDKTYMFYNGNDYGKEGIGVALAQ